MAVTANIKSPDIAPPLLQSPTNAYDISLSGAKDTSHSSDSNAVRIIQIGAWVHMIWLMLSDVTNARYQG